MLKALKCMIQKHLEWHHLEHNTSANECVLVCSHAMLTDDDDNLKIKLITESLISSSSISSQIQIMMS